MIAPSSPVRHDIQALRAIAVAMVVVFHAWPRALPGGYVGVDAFFVVSGYLITAKLLRELDGTGRIAFGAFYAGRIRRLMPAAALVVATTCVAVALTHSRLEARELVPTAVAAVAYVSNLWFAARSVDYLDEAAKSDPLLHTWSLGVEEQFYLLWPALLLAATRWRATRGTSRRTLLWLLLALACASLLVSAVLTARSASWAYFSLAARAWEFALGAFAVVLPAAARTMGAAARRAAVTLGLAAMAAAAWLFSSRTPFPGVAALLPAAGAFLVIWAGGNDLRLASADPLRSRLLAWLGDRSYTLYLWHWPVLIAAATFWPADAGRQFAAPAGVALSILLAALTTHWVENPVRHGARFRRPKAALALGAALGAAGIAVALGSPAIAPLGHDLATRRAAEFAIRDRPRLYDDRCFAPALQAEPPDCLYGNTVAASTVALIGDSHAAQWFPALEEWARSRRLRIAVFVKAACPLAAVEPFDPKLGRAYTECTAWRERVFARLAVLRPVLVVTSQASAYEPFAAGDAAAIAQWRLALEHSLDRLAALAGHVAIVRDTPLPGFHVPRCIARGAASGAAPACTFARDSAPASVAWATERAASALRPEVSLIDMTEEICPAPRCEARRRGVVLYHDTQHLSATAARALAAPLRSRLPGTVSAALVGR